MVKKYYLERKMASMDKIIKEKWLNLYENIDYIYDLAPWNYLNDNNLITIVDKNTSKLYYLFTLGKGGISRGLIIISEDNILDYLNIFENNFQPLQLINYQSGYMITYPNKNNVDQLDKLVPEKLGISFKDEWISIREYKKGYLPGLIKEYDIDLLVSLLDNYISIFKHIKNNEINIPDNDKMISRYYSKELKGYNNVVIERIFPEYNIDKIDIDYSKIKGLKQRNKEYEIELFNYFPISIADNYENNNYKLNYYIAISDRLNRKILEFNLINNTDYTNYLQFSINKLLDFFISNGIPKKVYVRDEYTKIIIKSLLADYDVEIIKNSNLYLIDSYLEMVVKKK